MPARSSSYATGSWVVYILRCADGSLYTGITKALERRTVQHNAGTASRYTRVRRPVEVVYREQARDLSSALKRERQIKKLDRQKKHALVAASASSE